VCGRHLRVQRYGPQEFGLGIFRTFQSGVRVSELEMREGIVGALRDIFLDRIERRGKLHFVDSVIGLL